jgi:predicted RecA/RadA family phage recombinase
MWMNLRFRIEAAVASILYGRKSHIRHSAGVFPLPCMEQHDMNRKKLSIEELKVETMVTGSMELLASTTIDDPGSTSPPVCNSIQTCVC